MNATPIAHLAALPAALFSGLLLTFVIVRIGRGKFPAALFRAAFSVGVVMATLVLLAEAPFELKANPRHFSLAAIAFGFAAFPEEAAKFAGAYLFVRGHWLRRDARELALGAATAALGFALFEDVLYIAAAGTNWGSVATARAVTAIPMHVFLGLFAGCALSRAELSRTRFAAALRIGAAWIVASLLHGFYDLALMIVDAKPPYPQYVQAAAGRLNVSAPALLHAVVLCAVCGVAGLALHAARAVGRPPLATREVEPPVIRPNWLLRLSLAPATGWIAGGLLLAVAALFLAMAAALSFVVDLADPVLLVALPAVFLAAIGLLLTRRATPGRMVARARPTMRRLAWAAVACAAVLAVFAGHRWGDKPMRTAVAFRIAVGGAQLAVKGDYEGAIREYDRALAINSDFADALANRAKANDILHRYDRARVDLDRAVALQPKSAPLLRQRAALSNEMHDYAATIADLDRALALSPNDPQSLVERAEAYSDSGDDARAAADLALAVALAPRNLDVLMAQSNAFIKSGDFDGARRNLDEIVKSNPNAANAYFVRGRLSLYQGDAAKAVADLQRAGAATPYPPMWLFAARARGGLDGGAQLEAQMRSWPSASWPYPVIRQMLGKMSAADARAAASNDDERCEADFYNGELVLARRDVESARSIFQRALGECPLGFIEREGADAELKRLGPQAATPPAAPASAAVSAAPPTPSAATPIPTPTTSRPDTAQPAPANAGSTVSTTGEGASSSVETVRTSASSSASVSAAKTSYSGMAVWEFLDRGAEGSELDADLMFANAPIHGELSLRRVASPREPHYELLFRILASDRARPPLSQLDDRLGAPTVTGRGYEFFLAYDAPFERVSDTTYRLAVPADEIQKFLDAMTRGEALSVKLGVVNRRAFPEDEMTLRLGLDTKVAHVAHVAAEAWN